MNILKIIVSKIKKISTYLGILKIKEDIKRLTLFFGLFILVGLGTNVFSKSEGGDLLDKVFKPSFENEKLIDLGQTKNQVGNEILRESVGVTFNLSKNADKLIDIQKKEPLIVRIAKILLRMTIVLSVTMVLWNGVLYIIQSSKGESPKEPQKNLLNIGIGLLLALSSLGIINLISSIGVSSLKVG